MSIASQLQTYENGLTDAYSMVSQKGGTMPIHKNMISLASSIGTIPSGGGVGIPREVVNGVYQMPSSDFTFSLPNGVTDLGYYAMYYAFFGCSNVISVDLGSLTTLSNSNSLYGAFRGCTRLTSVDLKLLVSVTGYSAMSYAFRQCATLSSINLSSLTTANDGSMQGMLTDCTSLVELDLSALASVTGGYTLQSICNGCTALETVNLNSLRVLDGMYALGNAFRKSRLTTLSFPSLTANSFGSTYTNQFSGMLQGVTGCTVHFPAAVQSTIGSWADVTNGFGGTNTTVLFDL